MWEVLLLEGVQQWFLALDQETAVQVAAAIDALEREGPRLGRPLVDRIHGSSLHNMKELRPGSAGRSEVRLLFVFDPQRQAVLLVAGDKSGAWRQWYREAVPLAEQRYQRYLRDGQTEQ